LLDQFVNLGVESAAWPQRPTPELSNHALADGVMVLAGDLLDEPQGSATRAVVEKLGPLISKCLDSTR
jgi:hypothetical protein